MTKQKIYRTPEQKAALLMEHHHHPQGRGDRGDLGRGCRAKKSTWGPLTGRWVPHDVRDEVVDFVRHLAQKTEISELIPQRARERFPNAKPRIISDNGPQFIAKDFKEFTRIAGTTHVHISPHYPQSNGKIERFHKTMNPKSIRVPQPSTLEEARSLVTRFVEHYNGVRLHSAIDYIAPNDMLSGKHDAIIKERDRRLEVAREQRRLSRQELARRPSVPHDADLDHEAAMA